MSKIEENLLEAESSCAILNVSLLGLRMHFACERVDGSEVRHVDGDDDGEPFTFLTRVKVKSS